MDQTDFFMFLSCLMHSPEFKSPAAPEFSCRARALICIGIEFSKGHVGNSNLLHTDTACVAILRDWISVISSETAQPELSIEKAYINMFCCSPDWYKTLVIQPLQKPLLLFCSPLLARSVVCYVFGKSGALFSENKQRRRFLPWYNQQ